VIGQINGSGDLVTADVFVVFEVRLQRIDGFCDFSDVS
jgi:hypothetical protein